MSMRIYTVNQITEADYGCEDTDRKESVVGLKLIADGEERYVEIPDSLVEKQGIREGKKVCFTENGGLLKYVRVVAAVVKDEQNRIFATARGYGEYKGWWEFPGGKIEKGETPQQALAREIKEELDTDILVGELIHTIEYDYSDFHLSMDCFWSEITKGDLTLLEAEEAQWLTKDTLRSVKWLPADLELINYIEEKL